MIYKKLQKDGDRYIISISAQDIEKYGLQEGQLLEIQPAPDESEKSDTIIEAAKASWEQNKDGYMYLKNR